MSDLGSLLPFGSGTGRPSSRIVSIHSWAICSTLRSASIAVGPSTQHFLDKRVFAKSAILDAIRQKERVSKVGYNYFTKLTVLATATPILDDGTIIAHSKTFSEVVKLSQRVAAFDGATVMILGESGTGKELVAELIVNNSPRKNKPFLQINCGAIPENLVESELFGYEKGAFTGADKTSCGAARAQSAPSHCIAFI